MRTFLAAVITSVLLCACNSTPVKKSQVSKPISAPLTHKQHYELGVAAMKRMDENANKQDMDIALHHFAVLFEQQPHNAAYQQSYYWLLFAYDYVVGKPSQRLLDVYDNLSWTVKKIFNPPAFIPFLISESEELDANVLIAMLLPIVSERPDSAYLWHKLSILYERTDQSWLAMAAAKQANMLEGDNAEFLYQLGDSINDVIQGQACVYDERAYAISAVKHIAKAAAKKPNQLYLDNTGLQYLRLGLLPLALQSLQKAYALEKNEWTLNHYIDVLLLLGRYEEASGIVDEYIALVNQDDVLEAEALIAASKGNWQLASDKMTAMLVTDTSIQAYIRAQWVRAIAGEVSPNIAPETLSGIGPWEEHIVKYFSLGATGDKAMADNYLISQAKNGCERTEAYFFSAYRDWKNKNISDATKALEMTRKQTATMYMEYMWSQVLMAQDFE